MKVLFICNLGANRSRTAAFLFKDRFETRYKGLYSNLMKEEDMEWADTVVVMEDFQRGEIGKRFPEQYMKKKIISFDIPDVYSYMQEELVKILEDKANSSILEIA